MIILKIEWANNVWYLHHVFMFRNICCSILHWDMFIFCILRIILLIDTSSKFLYFPFRIAGIMFKASWFCSTGNIWMIRKIIHFATITTTSTASLQYVFSSNDFQWREFREAIHLYATYFLRYRMCLESGMHHSFVILSF